MNPEEKSILQEKKNAFWSHVVQVKECWIWTGAVDKDGYGVFAFGRSTIQAHRFSYLTVVGELPPDMTDLPDGEKVKMVLLHSCDTPRCVNPYHLKIGTQKENMQDCSKKGRIRNQHMKGE